MRYAVLVLFAACDYATPSGLAPDASTPASDASVTPIDSPDAGEVTGAWLAGYSFRRRVVVTRAGSETLANFPLAIVLASDAAIAQHARGDGADLVVTTDDALTRLDS